jgi:hypothetical protein
LPLGQSVNFIIENNNVDVDVPPKKVNEMISADRHGIPVAGDHPHTQPGIGAFHP